MKKSVRLAISAAVALTVAALVFYVTLPAINVQNTGFWMFFAFIAAVFGGVYALCGARSGVYRMVKGGKKGSQKITFEKGVSTGKIIVAVVAVPLAVLLIGTLASSTFFNASRYSQIIEVKEAVFEEDMPETDLVSNIALMDSASANIIGNRTLGALSEVVSQYQINGTYFQINYRRTPKKVSTLEYEDFFKWANNREKGIPGYVMVDPVNSSAEYIEFETPIRYTESAYFSEDLQRTLRFSYPTKIFGSCSFEIDEEGKPYYIVSCMKPRVGLFGAMDVNEVIIFNPCDGSSSLYALADVPSWVDNVFTGDLASEKFDWYGTLKNGFWNSVIGNKDCKVTTDDFGYIIIEDDVWFFTGVTSVSNDESNIGFIISNARTGEYKFYPVIGAEEYSAMKAAEGEVQEKGYVASFPSLINVSGNATYIMVLKDSGGLVKLYALVNVENYSIVATGSTQTEAKEAYLKLLQQEGILKPEDTPEPPAPDNLLSAEITVSNIRLVTVSGESWVYLTAEDGTLYKRSVAADESVLLIGVGDKITVKYTATDVEKICSVASWERT
mgnify:CR=1 FL=1